MAVMEGVRLGTMLQDLRNNAHQPHLDIIDHNLDWRNREYPGRPLDQIAFQHIHPPEHHRQRKDKERNHPTPDLPIIDHNRHILVPFPTRQRKPQPQLLHPQLPESKRPIRVESKRPRYGPHQLAATVRAIVPTVIDLCPQPRYINRWLPIVMCGYEPIWSRRFGTIMASCLPTLPPIESAVAILPGNGCEHKSCSRPPLEDLGLDNIA